MNRHIAGFALGIALLYGSAAQADDIQLTLIPSSGTGSGVAGSTVGWGYSITNNTSEWIGTLAVSADNFTNGTPDAIFDYPGVAPGATVTEPFSLTATGSCGAPPCGLYDLTWDTTAPVGSTDSGTFIVSSDFFTGDPLNPTSVDLGPAPDASAAYMATVVPGSSPTPPAMVPEPSFMPAVGAGLVLICALCRPRRLPGKTANLGLFSGV